LINVFQYDNWIKCCVTIWRKVILRNQSNIKESNIGNLPNNNNILNIDKRNIPKKKRKKKTQPKNKKKIEDVTTTKKKNRPLFLRISLKKKKINSDNYNKFNRF